jgi:hypothetical protein
MINFKWPPNRGEKKKESRKGGRSSKENFKNVLAVITRDMCSILNVAI